MDIYQQVADATREVFGSMLLMEVSPQTEVDKLPVPFFEAVSGMVGIAGLYKGVVAVHAPYETAKKITSQFLMMEVDEISNDVLDAFGEIANMLAGSVKSVLSSKGKDIQLSVPSAISGHEYTLDIQKRGDHLIIPFESETGTFIVQVQYEKQNGF